MDHNSTESSRNELLQFILDSPEYFAMAGMGLLILILTIVAVAVICAYTGKNNQSVNPGKHYFEYFHDKMSLIDDEINIECLTFIDVTFSCSTSERQYCEEKGENTDEQDETGNAVQTL
ncbi:hypothetical protein CAPTEDRAFT_220453 [Capitella teleta]|uniref:Uncharacterized protein n=1 Tax=Capitella teleta TaxID=283909 RepID=R7V5D1_CAPTE|nr:hypothetical protein CAPTEDRAFT_220453 [Capitella teleta]|eukprot:ELU13754.1 hypothetical protein CAPTEDRAFT_220453 [Capitella teleta]